MCYSYVTVLSKDSDKFYKVARKEYFQLLRGMASIWHERQPAILTIDAAMEYLSKDTTSETAYKMLNQFPPDKMRIVNPNLSHQE